MPQEQDGIVTIHMLICLQYEDQDKPECFTQTFDVSTYADISEVDSLASLIADEFAETRAAGSASLLRMLDHVGPPIVTWEIMSPLGYQYSGGD